MTFRTSLPAFSFILFLFASLSAQETEVIYLSGTGYDRTRTWEFYCTEGMNSGEWTTIEVPSCWEQQGFGQYNYGHVPFDQRLKEEGIYRYTFPAKREWKGKYIGLVFEGVMTDALVRINGKQAGEVHQGAFYPFSYDISGLLKYGRQNQLEVRVRKFSENESVNLAERQADYWVFGGIFRPVYLEVKPKNHLQRVAVDARADGSFDSEITLGGSVVPGKISVEILNPSGKQAATFESALEGGEKKLRIRGKVDDPLQWSPEYPHLYKARFSLLDKSGVCVHSLTETIGFRTVEVRAQDGIYVNDVRIKYKGVCRHSFHPDHGRTSSKEFSIEVVNLIKDMNMNAVRMSHYPPDRHFLEVCDSLGLFVLDELAGWQRPPYDSVVGRKLLKEMIARDVNHPSIVMWDNGNEGGWNTAYDGDFQDLDIQRREVNHPWGAFGKTNTAHYVNYDYLAGDHFAPRSIFFPTEMIHGLYDGGLGAGLEDFWLQMWNDPLCAGGFLWVFADEAVKRTDTGQMDADGNHAPDGILGPYHEKEGSFYTIREIWSPVHFETRYITPEFNGIFRIQNRFHYTSLDQCTFGYFWKTLPGPDGPGVALPDALEKGSLIQHGILEVDALEPGQNGTLTVPLVEGWQEADVLFVQAVDPHGRLIHTWSWPVKTPDLKRARLLAAERGTNEISISESETGLVLESAGVSVELSKKDGRLLRVMSGGHSLPLSEGPVFRTREPLLNELRHFAGENSYHVVADFGFQGTLEWTFHEDGLLDMDLSYQPEGGSIPWTGAAFSFPEQEVKSVRFLGDGPYRVWKNRRKGVTFNVWEKEYNNTITGYAGFEYPEFKGYYSSLYWVRFTDHEGKQFTVYTGTEDLFLRLFTPGEAPDPALTAVQHPAGDVAFMLGIPAIGTKFKEAGELGPRSRDYQYERRRVPGAALNIQLSFDFRPQTDQP